MLGGVRVPHTQGVQAHSDGDVVLHALCDALLGAMAAGDIVLAERAAAMLQARSATELAIMGEWGFVGRG